MEDPEPVMHQLVRVFIDDGTYCRDSSYNQRLHSSLGHMTPEEFEQAYDAQEIGSSPDDAANKTAA